MSLKKNHYHKGIPCFDPIDKCRRKGKAPDINNGVTVFGFYRAVKIEKDKLQAQKDAERRLAELFLGNVLFSLVHQVVNCPGVPGKRCKKFRGHDGECG